MTSWVGSVPREDDFGVIIGERFVDGKTVLGPWAIMSVQSFHTYGVGLGVGKGQLYVHNKNTGKWDKA